MNFFDKEENATGSLASNLSSYPNSLVELLSLNVVIILVNIVNVISSSVLALIVGWKLGLAIVFGALLPLAFSGYLRIRLESKLEDDTTKRFSQSAALASEAVSAIRTVSSLALERHILSRYRDRLHGVAQRSIKALIWTMFWYSLSQSISLLAITLGFWYNPLLFCSYHIKLICVRYGGRLVSYGEYTVRLVSC